jgi:hypothetical protein
MLTFELVGAAFLLLCLAPLLARDPEGRRSSREPADSGSGRSCFNDETIGEI